VVAGLEVDTERCREAIQPASGATDALYTRVSQGEPFRSVYRALASQPHDAIGANASEGWRNRGHLGAPGAFDPALSRKVIERARAFGETERQRIEAVWAWFEQA
ncbi:MAG: hypothetical protein OES47_09165, partial [Acidobacteriota bacterium]|nr:hypothetical protein [Acidobacteriota bacterium]